MPPASGGRCGAQIPAAFAFARSSAISASDDSSSRVERGLVRVDVLLHERPHLGAALASPPASSARSVMGESLHSAGSTPEARSRTRSTSPAAPSGRSRPRTGRRAARETLEQGPFGYVAGGAGSEATMRANLRGVRAAAPAAADARRQRRARPLRRGARPALAGPVPARAGRRPLDRPRRRRARRRPRRPRDRRADDPLERRVDLARGRRRRARRRAALVPALLVGRPRARRQPRRPRRRRRLRRDRRHARHAHARLARATSATATCRSSRAKGSRSSSATRSSARGSTSRRRRTCRPHR